MTIPDFSELEKAAEQGQTEALNQIVRLAEQEDADALYYLAGRDDWDCDDRHLLYARAAGQGHYDALANLLTISDCCDDYRAEIFAQAEQTIMIVVC